jgi:hypothetical protein
MSKEAVMDSFEKRKFKRLPITLDLSSRLVGAKRPAAARKVGLKSEKLYKGCTTNVSPGGLYFETADNVFEAGNLLKVELTIPPTAGLLEFGGKIVAFAKVLRTSNLVDTLSSNRYGVALQFCRSPKLCM